MHWSPQFSPDDFSASCSLFTLTPGTTAQSPMSLFCPCPRLALPPQAWALLTRHRPRWLTLPLPVLEVRMDGPKWRVNWTLSSHLNLATLLTSWWKTVTRKYTMFLFWSSKCLFKNYFFKNVFHSPGMDLVIFFSGIWTVSLIYAGFRQLSFIAISIVPLQNSGRQCRGKQ